MNRESNPHKNCPKKQKNYINCGKKLTGCTHLFIFPDVISQNNIRDVCSRVHVGLQNPLS